MRLYFLRFQVLFAFMVGLHNLYWYYGEQKFTVPPGGFKNMTTTFGGSQGGARGKGGGVTGTTDVSGLSGGDVFHAVEAFQGSVVTKLHKLWL